MLDLRRVTGGHQFDIYDSCWRMCTVVRKKGGVHTSLRFAVNIVV